MIDYARGIVSEIRSGIKPIAGCVRLYEVLQLMDLIGKISSQL